MKGCLLLLMAGLYAGFLAAAPGAPEHYTLLGRSTAAHPEVGLDNAQRAWLLGRKELVLGTSAPITHLSISPPADATTKA